MRILFFSQFYPPRIGGVEKYAHSLSRGLRGRGHDVRVLACRYEGMPAEETIDGVPVRRMEVGRGGRWSQMARCLAGAASGVLRELRSVEIVHVHQVFYPAAAISLLPLRGHPLVVTQHGSGAAGTVRELPSLPLGRGVLRVVGKRAT